MGHAKTTPPLPAPTSRRPVWLGALLCLVVLGNALARAQRYDEAIPEYREALRLQPDYALAELNLGAVLLNLGGHEAEAATHLENALRLQPNLAPARQLLEQLRTPGRR